MTEKHRIQVEVSNSERELKIYSQEDCFVFQFLDSYNPYPELMDFAVWCFLPVAMAEDKDLHILGPGTKRTLKNARRLSELWSIWRPDLFADIDISFQQTEEKADFSCYNDSRQHQTLMFYSGGIDSTYTLLSRLSQDKYQDLLTIQGMDYKMDDHKRFTASKTKTEQLTDFLGVKRLFILSNGYNIYNKYNIPSATAFVFLLSSAGFIYHQSYKNCVLAADADLEFQFLMFPDYGSNPASNQHIDSGYFYLETDGEISRAEKLPLIAEHEKALKAVSFCKSYSTRPENCGECTKCIRTKLMFIAAIGRIPDGVFINPEFSKNMAKQKISKSKKFHFIELAQVYFTARRNGNLGKLFSVEKEFESLMDERKRTTLQSKTEVKTVSASIKDTIEKIKKAIAPNSIS